MCDAELILELPTASLAEVMPTNKEGEASIILRVAPNTVNDNFPTVTKPKNENDDDNDESSSTNQNNSSSSASSNINIISIVPTEAQVVETQSEIGVQQHQVQPAAGAPLIFILAGDYKIPLRKEVPCIAINQSLPGIAKAYQFDVLGLQLQIQFPTETTPKLTMQHFEEILVQQHCLTYGGESTLYYTNPTAAAQSRMTSGVPAFGSTNQYQQPQWDAPEYNMNNNKNSSTTNAIVSGISSVGTGVASGLRTGAVALASVITEGAAFVISNTDKTSSPVAVPESWTGGVKTARVASKGAVKVSSGVAKSLIGVTSVVSDVVSSKIRTVIKKKDEDEEPDSDTVRSLKLIGLTSADQAVSLYEAATDSARTILTATCAGICQVVEHKLGQEAGNFAEDGLGLVQDTYDASKAVGSVGAKGVLKSTIKATAVKTLKDDP